MIADRIAALEEALRLACSWAKIDLVKNQTVMSKGINDILNGRGDSAPAKAATDLAARAALAAGSQRAKTPKAVECEASQSGLKGNAQGGPA